MTAFDEFYSAHVAPAQGRTLVVGSHVYEGRTDRRALFADAVGVDLIDGPGVDFVADLEQPPPDAFVGAFAHVDCVSVLEHAQHPWLVAETLERVLMPGGTLFFSSPFCWRVHAYPNDYWRFTPACLDVLFPNIVWSAKAFGHERVSTKTRIPAVHVNGIPYMARTETFGFGRKP